jgi:hypothetical protein
MLERKRIFGLGALKSNGGNFGEGIFHKKDKTDHNGDFAAALPVKSDRPNLTGQDIYSYLPRVGGTIGEVKRAARKGF